MFRVGWYNFQKGLKVGGTFFCDGKKGGGGGVQFLPFVFSSQRCPLI